MKQTTADEKNKTGTADIGKKIRSIREYLGLTRNAFGRLIGYSGQSIKRFERGELMSLKGEEGLDHPVIKRICEVYHVDSDYFNGDADGQDKDGEDGENGEDGGYSGNRRKSAKDAVKKPAETKEAVARLKAIRKEKGLSITQLTDMAGLGSGHISRIERGENKLTMQTAEKLADALDVGVEWLLNGDESKKEYPVSEKLVDWLWRNLEIRKELWRMYTAANRSTDTTTDTLQDSLQDNPQVTLQVTRQEKILEFCLEARSCQEILRHLGLSDRKHFREAYLKPLLSSGKLKMTIPDKPNSRNQKYIKTS